MEVKEEPGIPRGVEDAIFVDSRAGVAIDRWRGTTLGVGGSFRRVEAVGRLGGSLRCSNYLTV